MVLRRWRGAVKAQDAERYLAHQADTGIREYRDTPGNHGAMVLTRPRGDLVEVETLSWWTDMDAVVAFAGPEPGRAKFYPGDEELLAEADQHVDHLEVVSADLAL